jgi:hypothetical protein
MIVLDHLLLVRRDVQEVAKFRRFLESQGRGDVGALAVAHEEDGSCCRREPWAATLSTLVDAIQPAVPVVFATVSDPGGG